MTQRMHSQYVQFYIDGSAAKQINYVAPKKVETLRQPKQTRVQKRKRIYVDPVAIFSLVVAVCMIVTIAVGMIQLNTTRQKVAQMEQYVVYLQHAHKDIESKYAASYNLEDIEKTALALGMVPADQVTHSKITVAEPVTVSEPTIWETVGTFLSGLFA